MKTGKKIGKKALKREAKKNARTPTRTSAIKPGTIEVYRDTEFGRRFAVIRGNAEAFDGLAVQPSLGRMLMEITRDLPVPEPTPIVRADRLIESWQRNQEIQRRMIKKMQEAVEEKWPGFGAMQGLLVERENEFTRALGDLGVGVA